MNRTKHTPGPWIIEKAPLQGKDAVNIYAPKDGDAWVATIPPDETGEQAAANAALIAAAPELLEALTDAYKWLSEIHEAHGGIRSQQRFHALSAAIAKAEGGAK